MDIELGVFDLLNIQTQLNFCLRIIAAAMCGCLIGYERSRRLKGAGVRTHMIIALAAALMTIVSKYGFLDMLLAGFNADASRVAAQIVAGIPFLGAGVIFMRQNQASVQGLTTAAGILATCGIGMALGAGLYVIGIFATALLMLLQFVLHKVLTGYDSSYIGEIVITADPSFKVEEAIGETFKAYIVTIQKSRVKKLESGKLEYRISFKTMREIPAHELAAVLDATPEFTAIEI